MVKKTTTGKPIIRVKGMPTKTTSGTKKADKKPNPNRRRQLLNPQ